MKDVNDFNEDKNNNINIKKNINNNNIFNSKLKIKKNLSVNDFFKHCKKHSKENLLELLNNDNEVRNNNFNNYNDFDNNNIYMNENYNIKNLIYEINRLKKIIDELKRLNNFFVFIINQKESLYRDLLKENSYLKSLCYNKKNIIKNKNFQNIKSSSSKNINNNNNILNISFNKIKPEKNFIIKIRNKIQNNFKKNKSENKSKFKLAKTFDVENNEKKNEKEEQKSFEYENYNNLYNTKIYENLFEISNNNLKNEIQNISGNSFLSLKENQLIQFSEDKNLNFFYYLTQNPENFLETLNSSSKTFLFKFCNTISIVIKNFQSIVLLIARLKNFLYSSNDLIKNILKENSINLLITKGCNILECEKIFLYIYDKISNCLIIQNYNNQKNQPIRIPKDKGLIGHVFTKKEKLKIDDVYQDPRFNPNIDQIIGFKTKNILCYPLFNLSGEIFGVIQAINKKKNFFNSDDEEIISIFSKQVSSILKNLKEQKLNNLYISRFKYICKYILEIFDINDGKKFTEKTENMLTFLFNSSNSQCLFLNKTKNLINLKNNEIFNLTNIGIIYFVVNNKNIHYCKNVNRCKYYNELNDINARDYLLTVPILYKEEVCCVIQTILDSEFIEEEKPKENDNIIIKIISQTINKWYEINKEKLFND